MHQNADNPNLHSPGTGRAGDSRTSPESGQTKARRGDLVKKLLSLLRPVRWLIAAAVLLAAATVLSNVGLLATSAVLISLAALQPPILDLMVYIVGVRFFGISRALLRYSERYLSHKITFRILTDLRARVYHRIEPAYPAGLTDYSRGQLFDRLLHDIEVLKYFYLRAVLSPLAALVVLGVCSLVLAQFSAGAAILLAALFLFFGVGVPLLMGRFTRRPAAHLAEAREHWQTLLGDFLGGLSELKSAGQSVAYRALLTEHLTGMETLERRISMLGSVTENLVTYGSNLSLVLALLVVVPAVQQGSMSGVYCAMVLLLSWASFEAIQPFPRALIQLQQSLEAAAHLDALPQIAPGTETPQRPERTDLSVSHVAFSYEAEHPVYSDLSLYCPEGSHIALVGQSGSGKSTLAWLLVRFWEPDAGEIRLGGIPLSAYPPRQLREYIGVVEQDTFLFTATVRENLHLAAPEADEATLRKALDFAALLDVTDALPDGLDTYLGDGGYRLSGGQRQRLSLARAWLRDCPVVVLDELFQGIDPATASVLRAHLEEWSRGRTVIHITHSLSHLQRMDRIYVLQNGTVAEAGTMHELLERRGLFYQMWRLEREEIGSGAA